MTRRVVDFHPEAIAEGREARLWYRLRSQTAEERFRLGLRRAIASIREAPGPLTRTSHKVTLFPMHAVTIREAKARLNALIEAAERGEQVVLMRGAKHVAAIVPLSADDLEVSSRITDAQAERLWRQIAEERRDGAPPATARPGRAAAGNDEGLSDGALPARRQGS